ncbi:hypothetical protein QJQ45_010350 [Haematococcus lacustris]|nr:hypothetical protein QJQ45_010350 [Haematococcus lacustris]
MALLQSIEGAVRIVLGRKSIKVPGGAVLCGCKKTKRKLMAHFQLRAEVHNQFRVFHEYCVFMSNSNKLTPYNQLQRRLGRPRQNLHFILKPAIDDPNNQELLAKLQQLGSVNLTERFVKLYAKAARARLGWGGEEAQLFIKMACGYSLNTDSPELQACNLDKEHVNDLKEEAAKQRRLLALEEDDSLQYTVPLPCHMRHAVHVCRWLEQWQQAPNPLVPGQPKRGKRRGIGPRTLTCPPPFTLTPLARVGVHFVKVDSRVLHGVCKQLGLTKETFTLEPALSHNWARWFNTHKLRNNEFAYNFKSQCSLWDATTGQLVADQLARWKLTKGQVKHASGLNNARRVTEWWLAPIKPHLQHLAAASSAGTSLVANLKHTTVTLATWDAVWEVYMDPKWARQRQRLYGAQDRALEKFFDKLEEDMAEVSMKRHGRAKQLVVFFGAAGIGTAGGWGADAVLRACCKVVCRPRGTDQRRGRVVLVNEHRTSRVSSAVNGQQPCEEELNKLCATRPAGWRPPAGQVEQRLVRPAWSQQRDQPVRGLITPLPAERSKRTKAEPAAEPNKGKGKAAKAKPAPQPGSF